MFKFKKNKTKEIEEVAEVLINEMEEILTLVTIQQKSIEELQRNMKTLQELVSKDIEAK